MLRVLQNLVHGFGLRFNIDERVQVYDSPLWLLLNLPSLYLWNAQPYLALAIIAISTTLAACYILQRIIPAPYIERSLVLILAIMASRSCREYLGSGLELPLIWLLLACFIHQLFSRREHPTHLVLIATLLALTHFSNVLLILPALVQTLWKHRTKLQISSLCLAFLPLVFWLIFCLIYYGFLFPTSYYQMHYYEMASHIKLHTVGWNYFTQSLRYDFYTPALIGAACLYGVLYFSLHRRHFLFNYPRAQLLALLSLGVMLDVTHTLMFGSGSNVSAHFVAPVFVSIFILYTFYSDHFRSYTRYAFLIITNLYIASLAYYYVAFPFPSDAVTHKGVYRTRLAEDTFTYTPYDRSIWRNDVIWRSASADEEADARRARLDLQITDHVGREEYLAGPFSTIIDQKGSTDLLLSRIPPVVRRKGDTQISHNAIPQGYIGARREAYPIEFSPYLNDYHEKLWLLKSAPLFDIERLGALLGIHMGWYDTYLESYIRYGLLTDLPPPTP
ncbi:MAG: hypothetical protein EBR02_02705 [Alphaproteobacteria bacterium]|nr:hypothetical protein [Alphaproteobacteria bacterium]